MEPETGFEPVTSSLPRRRSTPELLGPACARRPACAIDGEAGDEARTRDPQLGRLMLYQQSYSRLLELRNADFGWRINKTRCLSIRHPKSAFRNLLVQGV